MKDKLELKTSEKWMKDYPNITILDPSGWDISNFGFSFCKEMITREEFSRRLNKSTTRRK